LTFLFRRARLSVFICSAAFLDLLELSDQERMTCNVCVVQQYYSSQISLYLQVKETLVSFYVHQHRFLKFLPFSQEEGTRVVSCVHQHHCIIFDFFSMVRETVDSSVVQQHL
jgi:hypothetical protein